VAVHVERFFTSCRPADVENEEEDIEYSDGLSTRSVRAATYFYTIVKDYGNDYDS
jgi:hypothetical protein